MKAYVLQSLINQNQYVGMSKNPQRRLEEHNSGKVKSLCC
ncbi:MAG: GIY-YIG nuclease family protein [Flavobacteriales bacterium]|nr:GIY-YIG nuclease family protein [Flavobacteriales bacterium]